jgi:4-hydroxy-3-methylbut-2-enyl diphosphate reductase
MRSTRRGSRVSRRGVTASASTPELLVEQVVERLRAFGSDAFALRSLPVVDEGVAFQIPPELR